MSQPPAVAELPPLSLPRKLGLAAEILLVYCQVRWWLWRRGLSGTVSALRGDQPAETAQNTLGQSADLNAFRLGRAVTRTLSLLPTDSRCLVRSLVLSAMLARRGISASLIIGVRSGSEFGAHAWVECAGYPLLPSDEAVYERLLEI